MPPFAQLKEFYGTQFGSKELYEEIINAAEQQTKKVVKPVDHLDPSCFVAGTLVHTQHGLVPIEKIKVGDYVLSKPESGEGEQSYQRVVKTFVHEDQEVCCVDVIGWTPEERALAQATRTSLDSSKHFPLVVTANHPFWIVGKGWVEASDLHPGVDQILLADGSSRDIKDVAWLVRTPQADVGWLINNRVRPFDPSNNDGLSRLVDLRNYTIQTNYVGEEVTNDDIEWFKKVMN